MSTDLEWNVYKSLFPSKTFQRTPFYKERLWTWGKKYPPILRQLMEHSPCASLSLLTVALYSIWRKINKQMHRVSSLHLDFVLTCSQRPFLLPSLSSCESSPKWLLSPVLIHRSSSSCWINHHHAWRASERNLSHSSFYSPSCLLFSLFLPPSFFLSINTHLYTHLEKKIPSLPYPAACLGCLSWNCLTLPRPHTNTLTISKYTMELADQLEERVDTPVQDR